MIFHQGKRPWILGSRIPNQMADGIAKIDLHKGLKYMESWGTFLQFWPWFTQKLVIYIYLLKSFAFTQIHDMFFAHILLVWWISRRRKSKISPQKNGGSVFTWTTGVSFHPTWGVLKSRCSLSFYENFWILGIPLTRPDLEFKMRKECTLHSDQQILMPCCDCPENSTRLKNIWMYWFWKFKDELYSYTYTYITYVNSK